MAEKFFASAKKVNKFLEMRGENNLDDFRSPGKQTKGEGII